MKRICLFLSLVLGFSNVLQAQLSDMTVGGSSRAMGGTLIATQNAWSVLGNQANMAFADKHELGFTYENRFGLKELSTVGVALLWPTKLGNVGVGVQRFGYEMYNEMLVGVAYGRWLWRDRLAMGMKMNFYSMQLGEVYGSKSTLTGDLGIVMLPFKNLIVGVTLNNPFPQKLSDAENTNLPSVVSVGTLYKITNYLNAVAEVHKVLSEEDASLKLGVEYSWENHLYLRAGMETYPFRQTVGMGFKWTGLSFDVSFFRQDPLGYSPQLSLSYAW